MEMNRPCVHLAPAVKPLLAAGATFVGVVPAGEEFRFVHQLDRGAVPGLARALAKTHGIEYWTTTDSHYSRDCGFACRRCRLAVAWPQGRAVVDAI
jgi:hypothetical protein